jgi:hypothetical protein
MIAPCKTSSFFTHASAIRDWNSGGQAVQQRALRIPSGSIQISASPACIYVNVLRSFLNPSFLARRANCLGDLQTLVTATTSSHLHLHLLGISTIVQCSTNMATQSFRFSIFPRNCGLWSMVRFVLYKLHVRYILILCTNTQTSSLRRSTTTR